MDGDVYAFREGQRYVRELTLSPEDTVLDCGAHLGGFTTEVAPRVRQVFAFEPEPRNFGILSGKVADLGLTNVFVENAALTLADGEARFFLNGGTNSGSHHLKPTLGREEITVRTVDFRQVMADTSPDVVKMDIEGEEAKLLPSVEWDGVRELCFEWHFQKLNDVHWEKFFETVKYLRRWFEIDTGEPNSTWHKVFYARAK